MTPKERIAWAVSLVRDGKTPDQAHRETRVTTDVIRKACHAEGVATVRVTHPCNMGPGNLYRAGVKHATSVPQLGRYRSEHEKRVKAEQLRRGWTTERVEQRVAREICRITRRPE